jgi:hypothetical protein
MAANPRLRLSPLTVSSSKQQTEESARRLKGAHASIDGLFGTLHSVRDAKIVAGRSLARLSHDEVDLLRAALVFAGAGLDAVLKQLVRDSLPALLDNYPAAQGALKGYSGRLTSEQPAKAKSILMSSDPTQALRQQYIADLTKGSLQGHGELIAIRKALGLPDSGALSEVALSGFSDFFIARNQVAHELDLRRPTGRGTFTRRYRRMEETREQADAALILSGEFILAVERWL